MDRNVRPGIGHRVKVASLSARRAWIEMSVFPFLCMLVIVALRKESVDRNWKKYGVAQAVPKSLSARRAWIEIDRTEMQPGAAPSLSARRAWIEIAGPV